MTKTPATKRYLAWCERCYTCHLLETNSKREAANRAVSHMNSYRHETHVTDRKATRVEDSVS